MPPTSTTKAPLPPSHPPRVQIAVSGHRLRHFSVLLATAIRMGESVHLEPLPDALLVRSVAPNRSTHLLAVLDAVISFDRFAVHSPWELPDGTPIPNPSPPPVLKLLSKALAVTALRHGATTQSLEVLFDASVSPDRVRVVVTSQTGLVQEFAVNLQESSNEKAHVDNRFYRFECVADPKTWSSYINSLCSGGSGTQGKITILPTASRLVLRSTGTAQDGADTFSSTGSSSTKAPAFGSMVSADQGQFLFYSFPGPVASAAPGGDASQAGANRQGGLCNAPSVCTLPSQRPNPVTSPQAVTLVGKSIELRPLRQFLRLCEGLSLKTRVMTGMDNIPVFLEGVGSEGEPAVKHLSLLIAALDTTDGQPDAALPQHAPSNAAASRGSNTGADIPRGSTAEAVGVAGVATGGMGRASRLHTVSRSEIPSSQHSHLVGAQGGLPPIREETQQHVVSRLPTAASTTTASLPLPSASVVSLGENSGEHYRASPVNNTSSSLSNMAGRASHEGHHNIAGADSTIIYSIPPGAGGSSPSVPPRNHPPSILKKNMDGATAVYARHGAAQQPGYAGPYSETLPHVADEEDGDGPRYEPLQEGTLIAPSSNVSLRSGAASSVLVPATPAPSGHLLHHNSRGGMSPSFVPQTADSGRVSTVCDEMVDSSLQQHLPSVSPLSHAASSVLAGASMVLSTTFSQGGAARRRQQQQQARSAQSQLVPGSQLLAGRSSAEFVQSSQPTSNRGPGRSSPDLSHVLSSPVRRDNDGNDEVASPIRHPHHHHIPQATNSEIVDNSASSVVSTSSSRYGSSVPSSGAVVECLSYGGVGGSPPYSNNNSSSNTSALGGGLSVKSSADMVATSDPQYWNLVNQAGALGKKRAREEYVVDGTPPTTGGGVGPEAAVGVWNTPRHVSGTPMDGTRSPNYVRSSSSPSFVPGTEERNHHPNYTRKNPTPIAATRDTAPPANAPPPPPTSASNVASMTPAEIASFYSQFVVASSSDEDEGDDHRGRY